MTGRGRDARQTSATQRFVDLWPESDPGVIAQNVGRPDALAAHLAEVHDLTPREAEELIAWRVPTLAYSATGMLAAE